LETTGGEEVAGDDEGKEVLPQRPPKTRKRRGSVRRKPTSTISGRKPEPRHAPARFLSSSAGARGLRDRFTSISLSLGLGSAAASLVMLIKTSRFDPCVDGLLVLPSLLLLGVGGLELVNLVEWKRGGLKWKERE
jgi:hypothetical protein